MKLKRFVYLSLIAVVVSSLTAQAQTYRVIFNFTGNSDVGSYPRAGVTLKAGDLYGSAQDGGYWNAGTVYRMTHVGSDWTAAPIFVFSGTDGWNPQARVVFGPDSNLYGTAHGFYTYESEVFELVPPLSICNLAKCFWTQNVFDILAGSGPGNGDLVWDQQGNIYGTTALGGAVNNGTVYEMTKSGNDWTVTTIYSFSGLGPDGQYPQNGVILDKNGNLFGTTASGGFYGLGTVFELTYVTGVGWKETVLHYFGVDGANPNGGLVFDSSGNLYGTTPGGGPSGGGSVFELSPSGDAWTFKLLYSFQSIYACGPQASLTLDAAGNLYGTTVCDGQYQWGSVFKLSQVNGKWVYTSLHDLNGLSDGAYPYSNVTIDTDGTLYGTAATDGHAGGGVVWMIKP